MFFISGRDEGIGGLRFFRIFGFVRFIKLGCDLSWMVNLKFFLKIV